MSGDKRFWQLYVKATLLFRLEWLAGDYQFY